MLQTKKSDAFLLRNVYIGEYASVAGVRKLYANQQSEENQAKKNTKRTAHNLFFTLN